MSRAQSPLAGAAPVPSVDSATTWIVLFSFLAVSLAGVLLRPALPVDETRYLAVAWEMHLSGDWLVPTKNFAVYSDKPPLLFWAINLVWSLTGVSDTAARMVGPGFAAIALWLTGRLARALWPEDAGIGVRATLALVALPLFAVMGGLTMFDAALTVSVLAGLLGLVGAGHGDRRGPWVFGAALAFGVLVKGPVVLLHLLPAAASLTIWHPARPGWRQTLASLGLGLTTGLVLVLLWLVPAAIHGGPEYRRAILWTQSAGRVADSFAHARPWWFFAVRLPLIALPWVAVPRLWSAARHTAWSEGGLRLCLIWGVGALIAFSLISGKQLHYLFPELPVIALVVARLAGKAPVSLRPVALPFALVAVGAFLVGCGLIPADPKIAGLRPPSALIAIASTFAVVVWAATGAPGLERLRAKRASARVNKMRRFLSAMKHGNALAGGAMLSLVLTLCADLVYSATDLGERYDSAPIAKAIIGHEPQGIAWVGDAYSAEFNFAGRLTRPVALPGTAELPAWIAAHPGGAIVGPESRVAPGWAPELRIPFLNKAYAIWIVPDRPKAETAP
ncbi:Glycosyltransferase [uncultured Pleomorphomonas sp.]|uniref:Glycosyltransferase RgtA/B/C/D-like domain-containing protein n=2 Tax=Pleomorphomonas TaxID=261933 RepID=A0A2G9X1C9_9HYPH|nr:glycosyltransferase family 39 protein [Pleomorphomonas carboxyditropha]PIP00772.1 hypothetical protein CJ014_01315 [Pleomorphomonas carboxyditropha]SCM72617.1 Glycosyltransferase [uncultured Pleomorphomonas sp.]